MSRNGISTADHTLRLRCAVRLNGKRCDLYKVLPLASIIYDALQLGRDAVFNPIRTALGAYGCGNVPHDDHAEP